MGRLVLLVALGSALVRADDNPVSKVVELITEMKAKIEADGQTEQKVYDKFACWCEKTTSKKATAIEQAKALVEELSSTVTNLKGKTATLKADVAQLEKDIAGNVESAQEADSIRKRETASYENARGDLEQGIGAMERAIGVLTGAGEKASAIQQTEILSVAGSLKLALRNMPKGSAYSEVSDDDRKTVEAFVNDPSSFYGDGDKKLSGLQVKNPFGDYAPASGAIQGILKGMYDSFTADLEGKNADQAMKQKQYEELKATKSSELKTMQATIMKKKVLLGEDTKSMTDASVQRDETQAILSEDEAFFAETKTACKAKADDWSERSRLRTEELAGINKAITILSSDEAKASFAQTSMLLQVRRGRDINVNQEAAYRKLKVLAGQTHSMRLATLAASVKVATQGNFDAVIVSVDKMIASLRQEEQDDITLRDYCQAEETRTEHEIEDFTHEMATISSLIERLEAKVAETKQEIVQAQTDIGATQDAMAEALSNRMSENEEFKLSLKDNEESVSILASAMSTLTQFYTDNKLPLSLVQQEHRPTKAQATAGQPEGAPATFSEPYEGSSSQSGGIISILGYLKEDLETEIKTLKAEEAQAQAEFAEGKAVATKTLEALEAKKVSLEQAQGDLEEQIADSTETKQEKGVMKEHKKKYREELRPKCDWIKGSFEERREKRKEEMNGLLLAKTSLAGGAPGGRTEESSLQKGTFLAKHAA